MFVKKGDMFVKKGDYLLKTRNATTQCQHNTRNAMSTHFGIYWLCRLICYLILYNYTSRHTLYHHVLFLLRLLLVPHMALLFYGLFCFLCIFDSFSANFFASFASFAFLAFLAFWFSGFLAFWLSGFFSLLSLSLLAFSLLSPFMDEHVRMSLIYEQPVANELSNVKNRPVC